MAHQSRHHGGGHVGGIVDIFVFLCLAIIGGLIIGAFLKYKLNMEIPFLP
jgi:hypothetical protein